MNLNEFRARLKQLRVYKAEMERRLKRSPMRSGVTFERADSPSQVDWGGIFRNPSSHANLPPMPAPLPNSLKQKTLNRYADLGEQIISEYRDPNIDHDAEWYKKYYRLVDDIDTKANLNARKDWQELWLNQISNKPEQILYNQVGKVCFGLPQNPGTRLGCSDAYMDSLNQQRQFIVDTLNRLQRKDRSR